MTGVNPQGLSVHSFKVPSNEELDHDYLWRYSLRVPARGEIGIFNRSHYEEVLVVRVHPELLDRQKLPQASRGSGLWTRRYREINEWERTLSDNGIKIVKLFLNLSKEEQRSRFLRRIDLPDHNWKFSSADVREREYWDDYQKAFSAMLSHTSTDWAPWHVIPADRKWYARIAAAAVIANALIEIDLATPRSAGGRASRSKRSRRPSRHSHQRGRRPIRSRQNRPRGRTTKVADKDGLPAICREPWGDGSAALARLARGRRPAMTRPRGEGVPCDEGRRYCSTRARVVG